MLRRLKIGCLFALWFLLSVGYSITNKRVNNLLPGVPCTVAASTVGVGSILVCTLWATGLRSAPRLSPAVVRILLPIGICHAIGHLAGTVSVAVGSVSFTQIVKAANPIYTCVLSMAVLGTRVSRRVWLSLLPIIVGVALATVKEVSFVPAAFATAAVSDLSMATRNVLSKKSMGSLTDVD
jgi:solute carrier family 35 protein E1